MVKFDVVYIYSSPWWWCYAVAVLSEMLVKGYLCVYILYTIDGYEVGGRTSTSIFYA
jgi:hypothetical protein